jgi:hypothetical protein
VFPKEAGDGAVRRGTAGGAVVEERPGAMSEGSWTCVIVRCWWPSWIQRALQLVQKAIGYRPKAMEMRADPHIGQRGMREPL